VRHPRDSLCTCRSRTGAGTTSPATRPCTGTTSPTTCRPRPCAGRRVGNNMYRKDLSSLYRKKGRERHVQKGLVVPAQEGGSGTTYTERTCRPCTYRPCAGRTTLGEPKELIPADSENVLILRLRCTWYIRIGTDRQVSGILLHKERTSAEKCAINAFLGGSSS